MKAVGFKKSLSIQQAESLVDFEMETPQPKDHDLLVEVKAISVNPVDYKVRQGSAENELKDYKIIGYDASGIVTAVGNKVTLYKPGDEVYYSGDITRPGTNSQFHLIDEFIVGNKPKKLSFSQSASIPLTGITAWEALFDRMKISKNGKDTGKSILIIGGAGGVGSLAIQLSKKLAKLKVFATASRPESIEWVKKLGADQVLNHRNNLTKELKKTGNEFVDYILCLNDTDGHWDAMGDAIKPQGTICTIVENNHELSMNKLKLKSVTFALEFMFTRSMFQTTDRIEQKNLLDEISQMLDRKMIEVTTTKTISPINAENLRKAHQLLETNNFIGKLTLESWE